MTTRRIMVLSITMGIGFLLTSCGQLEYEIEEREIYRNLIGRKYRVKETISISGVRGSDQIVDYVIIGPRPGLSGPEIGFVQNVRPGNLLEVTEVERCLHCVSDRIRLVVKILGVEEHKDKHIVLDTYYSKIVSLEKAGRLVVDESFLEGPLSASKKVE